MEGRGSSHSSPIKGSASRKLGASSYLLELVPDTTTQSSDVYRHRMHIEGFPAHYQLTDSISGSHSMHSMTWGGGADLGRGGAEETRHQVPRHRLPRFKYRTAQQSSDMVPSDSISIMKDPIIFTESSAMPGVPVVFRSPEERAANPERLTLDRRQLMVCPILEGEERLRLLNLQHNSISRLQHLGNLKRLVFLDLYDNLVHEIAGLESLVSLRVLMLGRNRIRKIFGLSTLLKLDVLDLHGNLIRDIECLSHLTHLRVLNLAGNNITCVSGLAGLQALAELNLRRNRITNVYELDELTNLQRLFLSHNLIQSFDDAPCLTRCDHLTDLSLDGNPVANAPDHRQAVIYRINQLQTLDQKPVTEEERQEALAAAREEEETRREHKKQLQMEEQRESTVSVIRAQWQLAHPELSVSGLESVSSPALPVGACAIPRADHGSLACTSLPHVVCPTSPSHYVEHKDVTLHLYGTGALEAMETSASLRSKQPIREIHFSYMEFEEIAHWIPKLVLICPNVTSWSFECTNMTGLEQLNALAQLTTPFNTLTIHSHGNPITSHPLFTMYTLYRLSHLGLSMLNGETVKDKDLVQAEQLFGRLSQLTTSHLPQARLLALISKYRPRGFKKLSANSSFPLKSICSEPVNRVALHHFSSKTTPLSTDQEERLSSARSLCHSALNSTLLTHQKLRAFEALWPSVMSKLVSSAIEQYADMDTNMKSMLDTL